MSGRPHDSFVVAECRRRYSFDQNVELVCATFSADAEVQLYINGEIVATGPSTVGGDFLGNGKPREWFYKDKASFSPILPSPTEARKPSLPTVPWEVRKNVAYTNEHSYNGTISSDIYVFAEETPDIWSATPLYLLPPSAHGYIPCIVRM